jgi:cobalt-zinc-cadmium efflux system membrane fusion protein
MTAIHIRKAIRPFAWAIGISVLVLAFAGCGEQGDDGHGHDGHGHNGQESAAAHRHDSPHQTCFICDPAKRDKGRLWCKEHGRYEDRCWLCHPELEDKDRLYCKEHSLYEDECFLCHPELKGYVKPATQEKPADSDGQDEANADAGKAGRTDGVNLFCNEHGVAEIECAICQPELAVLLEPGDSMKVRFPSTTSADKVGIQTSRPQTARSTPMIEALCEVQYNLNAMARITPLAGGVIRNVQCDVGNQVAAGDVLLELHSAQVASAKSHFLSALVERDIRRQAFEREKRLKEQNIAAEKDFLEAQAAHRAAELALNNFRQKLVNLGFTEAEIEQVQVSQDTSATLVIRAPFDGTLIERNAVVGEAVKVGEPVFTLADLSNRWLMLSVPSRHIASMRRGQRVESRFDELPGVAICGRIIWIDTSVDPRSRMIRARALVTENVDRIKTGLFGKARIITGDAQPATIVPRDAIQRHEGGTFVFVQNEPDLFSLRRVALGQSNGDSIEVLVGLQSTDQVVTGGSFIVMSELLKSRLGAGCADH